MVYCSGVIMGADLIEDHVWYKDDLMGMVETHGQKKQRSESKGKDEIPKSEDN